MTRTLKLSALEYLTDLTNQSIKAVRGSAAATGVDELGREVAGP